MASIDPGFLLKFSVAYLHVPLPFIPLETTGGLEKCIGTMLISDRAHGYDAQSVVVFMACFLRPRLLFSKPRTRLAQTGGEMISPPMQTLPINIAATWQNLILALSW